MEFRNYTINDYLEYEDLNQIEEAIADLLDKISTLNIDAFEYNGKVWELNEFVYSTDILNIINGIQKFRDEYVNFNGLVDLRQYRNKKLILEQFFYSHNTEIIFSVSQYRNKKSIDYEEINNWINNLQIMYNNYADLINYNIWDYNYLLNWNENSTIEWEE